MRSTDRRQFTRRVFSALAAACTTAWVLAGSAHAAPVGLGTAGTFAGLSGSAVTNTGSTLINGDLGVSPGTAISGFPPGTVTNGSIHANDDVAIQAQADLTTAYDDAAKRSPTATISADLAGSTLSPGVYTSATSLGLTGDLTLDAHGDPDAVFVFQAGSTLILGSRSRVLLAGSAQACNVFWQVGSSATLGTGSELAGSILALTSITLDTGARVRGRALARKAALTMDSNSITSPTCAPSAWGSSVSTPQDASVRVPLNGTDASGAAVTYSITTAPAHGTLGPIDNATGTVVYTPDAAWTGTDTFTYTAASSHGTSSLTTATVTVTPAPGPPEPASAGTDATTTTPTAPPVTPAPGPPEPASAGTDATTTTPTAPPVAPGPADETSGTLPAHTPQAGGPAGTKARTTAKRRKHAQDQARRRRRGTAVQHRARRHGTTSSKRHAAPARRAQGHGRFTG